jgi:hypothetical protein
MKREVKLATRLQSKVGGKVAIYREVWECCLVQTILSHRTSWGACFPVTDTMDTTEVEIEGPVTRRRRINNIEEERGGSSPSVRQCELDEVVEEGDSEVATVIL